MKKKVYKSVAKAIRYGVAGFLVFLVALPVMVSKAEAREKDNGTGYHPGCHPVSLICRDNETKKIYFVTETSLKLSGTSYWAGSKMRVMIVMDTDGNKHGIMENERDSDFCMEGCLTEF